MAKKYTRVYVPKELSEEIKLRFPNVHVSAVVCASYNIAFPKNNNDFIQNDIFQNKKQKR